VFHDFESGNSLNSMALYGDAIHAKTGVFMASWGDLVSDLEVRFQIVDKTDDFISIAFSWDDGRSQQVNIQHINIGEESVALVMSPVVPYSREAADNLFLNYDLSFMRSDRDGYISMTHPIHIDHMPIESCVKTISRISEIADEIEKTVTGGSDAIIGAKLNETDSDESESESFVIPSGQYVVGSEIEPGMYRFAGYVARLDREMQIIDNESTRSGLGLIRVNPHDSYFEVSGEAIRLENYPTYPVLENEPRGGIYLVNSDIPPGRYRINGDGSSAYYATYDKQMNRLNSDLNRGSLILTLQASAYAIEFTGRIEKI